MTGMEHSTYSKVNPKELVASFLDALNKEDYVLARKYVTHDLKFVGVMGSRNGAESYFSEMSDMRLKYDIKKILGDGNDVCVFYDITMSGVKIFSAGWYHVRLDKISSFRVVFDPRPLLEHKEA